MVKNYIKNLTRAISIVSILSLFSYVEAGHFLQPFLYLHKTNGNSIFLLPYKDGSITETEKGTSHIDTLGRFLCKLTSGHILKEDLCKIAYIPYKMADGFTSPTGHSFQGDNFTDSTKFSFQVATWIHKIRETSVASDLGAQAVSIEKIVEHFEKYPVVLYIFNNDILDDVQERLSMYKLCTQLSSSNLGSELIYSLFRKLKINKKPKLKKNEKRKWVINKKCYSKDCKANTTISCGKCHSLGYCSSDCKGYQAHLSSCNGSLLDEPYYRRLKNESSRIISYPSTSQIVVESVGSNNRTNGIAQELKSLGFTVSCGRKEDVLYGFVRPQDQCALCQNQDARSLQRCSKCLKVCYCSTQCQRDHWKEHKKICQQLSTLEKPHITVMYYPCDICPELTTTLLFCRHCRSTTYCSSACQKKAIPTHFKQCKCSYCKKPSEAMKLCAGCKATWYCSKDCQRTDWKKHKHVCRDVD